MTGCGGDHHSAATRAAVAPAPARLTGTHPCPDQPEFSCSSLRVPVDHAGQAGGRLALAVGVASGRPAPRGVLLFLTGGPGQPGIPLLTRIQSRLGAAIAGYRLVMFDQRGTGAGALDCPGVAGRRRSV